MLMWIFTRLSALAMYALILFAIIGALVMGARNQMNLADVMRWAFMPNITHVQSTDVPDLDPWIDSLLEADWPARCCWWRLRTACTGWWSSRTITSSPRAAGRSSASSASCLYAVHVADRRVHHLDLHRMPPL